MFSPNLVTSSDIDSWMVVKERLAKDDEVDGWGSRGEDWRSESGIDWMNGAELEDDE